MPKQNRVTPFGEIIATPERGTMMGNRGVLHDKNGLIQRAWQGKRWIVCVLQFRGRRREVMSPNHYTELFFLDEATALAAGHRPCAECRRQRFNSFRKAWQLAHTQVEHSQLPTAAEIDNCLHMERTSQDPSVSHFLANVAELPSGVFVKWEETAYLVWNDQLLPWTAAGYSTPVKCPKNAEVLVLTPKLTVAAIRAGYLPEIHPSAAAITAGKPTPQAPLVDFETNLFGALFEFHKKTTMLLRQSSLNEEQRSMVAERLNTLLDNVNQELNAKQSLDLPERLDAVYNEISKLLEEISEVTHDRRDD